MVTQCAWCNGIKLGAWYLHLPWVRGVVHGWSLRLPMGPSLIVKTTHGVCPECAGKVYERATRQRSHRLGQSVGDVVV